MDTALDKDKKVTKKFQCIYPDVPRVEKIEEEIVLGFHLPMQSVKLDWSNKHGRSAVKLIHSANRYHQYLIQNVRMANSIVPEKVAMDDQLFPGKAYKMGWRDYNGYRDMMRRLRMPEPEWTDGHPAGSYGDIMPLMIHRHKIFVYKFGSLNVVISDDEDDSEDFLPEEAKLLIE